MIYYELIRSGRKTLAIEVRRDCKVIVRAPYNLSQSKIDAFITKKQDWIVKHLEKNEQSREDIKHFSESELETLFREANNDIPFRVNYYANLLGVTFNKITIKKMKTQWGSCSSKSNLNFNCLLMLCPEDIRNYVVVHELCHRIEMNHSRKFWIIVERILPDYRTQVKWLKDNGGALISRL